MRLARRSVDGPLCPVFALVEWTGFVVDRFRDALPADDDKPSWERKGEGIAPLAPDTEVVENIHDHRYCATNMAAPRLCGCLAPLCWVGSMHAIRPHIALKRPCLCAVRAAASAGARGCVCIMCVLFLRFRDHVQDDEKPLWENKGGGIVPLAFDTSPAKNIVEHRHVSLCCPGSFAHDATECRVVRATAVTCWPPLRLQVPRRAAGG